MLLTRDSTMENRQIVDKTLSDLDEEVGYNAFVCALRLPSQMSKEIPDDSDGLQRLIAEKEKDLELAARIGQSLLSKNSILQHNHDELAQLYTLTQDELIQMRHELVMNKELLRICLHETPDYECGEEFDSDEHASIRQIQILQRKVRFLEDENQRLQLEAKELSAESVDFDTKETEIIHDCVKELAESNIRIQALTDRLKKKTEENAGLQEEVANLLNDMVDLQSRIKKVSSEKEDLQTNLDVYKEHQNQLAQELIQLQDKYDKLCRYAQDLEDELKELRRKDNYIQSWAERSGDFSSADTSLAAELSLSLQHVYNSVGCSEDDPEEQYRKVMDIVRLVNVQKSQAHTRSTTVNSSAGCVTSVFASSGDLPGKIPDSSRVTDDCIDTPRGSYFSESECSARTISSVNRESSSLLDDGICDKSCFGASSLSSFDIRQCATPDSAMSIGGSDAYYCHKTASSHHDLPSKLQLIKPMEGSVTLAKWQLLATPNMGAFLESRPGIYNRSQDPEADKIIADVATKKELRGIEQGSHLTGRDLRTSSTFTFSNARSGGGDAAASIFSLGSLKKDVALPLPAFIQSSTTKGSSSPGVDLSKILNTPKLPANPEEIILIEDPPLLQKDATGRSRRSSGSLSSASRSPSPPVTLDSGTHLSSSGALSSSAFDKMYRQNPLLSSKIAVNTLRNLHVPTRITAQKPI